ncbi:hypothetical protein GLOIN_2v1877766 [Rhizophagus clarus]|uniref:Uncharacterized protein n=1 Tax=Rhizophagus clarus TaxID=94130 RepID=A0A8H3R5B4_9GLOM|nr:hypothetical protein GLOIN_2v1877766 [Rhizophagus clarus]
MYMVCKGAINDKNEAKAFVWHLISSINGNAVAQHNLGLYFQYGKETDNVIKEAEARLASILSPTVFRLII